MAPHSSTLAWKIPWIEEPGGPPCVESFLVLLEESVFYDQCVLFGKLY